MRLLTVMTLTALLIVACGGGDTGEDPTPTIPTGTEGGVILEIGEEGGFVPVEFNLQRVPRFTVFDDGTVVTPTGNQFRFPGPALVPLVRHQLDDATLTDLLDLVRDSGLDDIDAVDLNEATNVADASTTVVRYYDDEGEHRISIYALGFDGPSTDARAAIVESMIERLDEATDTSDPDPYLADRLVVFSQAAGELDPAEVRSAGSWPFDFTISDMTSEVAGYACLTLDGEEANAVADVLDGADSMTVWDLDGTDHRVLARPLLPHQDGC